MGGLKILEKILEKSLDGIRIIFYLWRVGGFVLIDRLVLYRSIEKFHNIAYGINISSIYVDCIFLFSIFVKTKS
jgi:hypothetical protein